MFGLPIATERKQQLPKKAIYAKFDLKPAQRESFDADISRIDIVAVVSPVTIPAVSIGESVKEFYVLEIQMKRKEYDVKNILLLTKLIDQKMIFALQYEGQIQFAIFHTKLFQSVWQPTEQAVLPLSGLSLDTVWENIVKNIGLIDIDTDKSLQEQIKINERRVKIKEQIKTLEKKLALEKQPKKKRKYFLMIKELEGNL